ncbi:hypothetical protein [Acinetobacter sp. ANC 4779]|uniref:hypothetical protein n=1 Tax=Acinetobacter sp. ANC 4779 TaxID=2529848 RepID=UPI001BC86F64|nr:hypothetical protein [Acinetobacter sp. ANC 4779]
MLLSKIFKSLSTMLNVNETSSDVQAIAKMDVTIARLQQAKPVGLLQSDYLE